MPELKSAFTLDPHQADVVDFAMSRPSGGANLWLATGVGKGFIAIHLICEWLNQGVERILVTAPASLSVDWMKKLLKYAGLESVEWDKAKPTDRIRIISHTLLQKQPKTKATRRDRVREVVAWHPQAVIADEVHLLSNYKAAQTKGILDVIKLCRPKYRIGMTGTEVTRVDPEQLRPQLLFADWALMEKYGVADWLGFRKKFCQLKTEYFGGTARDVVTGVKNQALLDEITKQICIKMTDEVLQLEEARFEECYFKMSSKAARYYAIMEREGAILETETGLEILTDNPLTRVNRMLQIRSGFVGDFEGKIHDIDNGIISAVVSKAQSLKKPLLIFYHFRHTGDRLARALREAGFRLDQIQSGISATKKSAIEEQFQSGLLDIVLGQSQAMARGYTMTAACHTIYAEPEVNLEPWLQSLGRTRRRGQTQQCSYHKMIADNTIDADWYDALENKQDFASMLTSGAFRLGKK